MKHLFLPVILCVCFSLSSMGQNLALVTNQAQSYTYSTGLPARHQKHKASTLSSIGGCALIGGIGIYAWGYLKVQDGKSQSSSVYLPSTGQTVSSSDNQSKINTGHTLETIGEVVAVGGLVMIIVDAAHPHHKKAKVEVVSPQGKSLGLVYNF